jgi:tetratricopeptide (TPR) repeat protein
LQAAEALYGPAVLEPLDQLAAKSLILVDSCVAQTRYRMLETIRQYGDDRLEDSGESRQTHQRHLEYFVQFVQEAELHQHGPLQKTYRDRLEVELDNLRAALAWVEQSGDALAGERLVQGLWWFWYRRGYVSEGLRWIDALLLANSGARDFARAMGLAWSAWLLGLQDDIEQAYKRGAEALSLALRLEDQVAVAYASVTLGFYTPDPSQADELLDEAGRIAQDIGRAWEETASKFVHGMYLINHGELVRAQPLMAESLAGFRRLHDQTLAADANMFLGHLTLARGEYAQAQAMFEESIELGARESDVIGTSQAFNYLSAASIYLDDFIRATASVKAGLAQHQRMGLRRGVAQGIGIAAAIIWKRGQPEQAANLLAVATNAHENWTDGWLVALRDCCLGEVRATLGEDAFARAWAEGAHMTLKQAVEVVMAM